MSKSPLPKKAAAKAQVAPVPAAASKKRVFKSSHFSKAAEKRGIEDTELCEAMAEVMLGQAVDLGGGVWKKKLNDNMDRSIIAAKGKINWFFVFLFQKSDRENIDQKELVTFKKLADWYAKTTDQELEELLKAKDLVEICNEDKC